MVEKIVKDYVFGESEIVRERLEGHKGAVNSLDMYNRGDSTTTTDSGYLASAGSQQYMLSASDDGTALIWDMRTNKKVM
jgi:WD40 repeat protein